MAADDGRIEVVRALLEAGANISHRDNDGLTALLSAAEYGRLDVAQALLEAGADLEQQDEFGYTALNMAAQEGHIDVVQALLEAGADVNHRTYDGDTPLFRASLNDHLDIVKALLAVGADPNLRNNDGDTVLDRASPEVAEYLRSRHERHGRHTKSAARRANMHTAPDARKIYRLKRDLKSYSVSDIDLLKGYYGVNADDRDDVLWMIAVENYSRDH